MSQNVMKAEAPQTPDYLQGSPLCLPLPDEIAEAFPPGNYICEMDGMTVATSKNINGGAHKSLRFWSMARAEGETKGRSLHFAIPIDTNELKQVLVNVLERVESPNDYCSQEIVRLHGPGTSWSQALDALHLVNTGLDRMSALTFEARIEKNPPVLVLGRAHWSQHSNPHRNFYPG